MLTPAQWQAYRNVIDSVHDSFNQDSVTWRRHNTGFQRYGEDAESNETWTDITLRALMGYNIFRVWPMTKESVGGGTDSENVLMILNKKYLSDAGYLNSDGFFAMDPGKDFFIIRGLTYRASGETEVAQAGDVTLLFYIILSREETRTGELKY